jgi:hypothetical protein
MIFWCQYNIISRRAMNNRLTRLENVEAKSKMIIYLFNVFGSYKARWLLLLYNIHSITKISLLFENDNILCSWQYNISRRAMTNRLTRLDSITTTLARDNLLKLKGTDLFNVFGSYEARWRLLLYNIQYHTVYNNTRIPTLERFKKNRKKTSNW